MLRERAGFLTAYIKIEEPRYAVNDVIRLLRDGPIRSGTDSIVNLLDEDDEASSVIRQQLDGLGPSRPRSTWARVAENADTWRQCAIVRLPYDIQAGKSALLEAASSYQQLGLPFGSFLRVAATGSWEAAGEAGSRLRFLLLSGRDSENGEEEAGWSQNVELLGWRIALQAPAQQISLLFAAVSDPSVLARHNWLFDALAAASQAADSAPVGTTAQPMALWWNAGRRLAELTMGVRQARTELRSLVADLAVVHGRQLAHAQLDGYHWPMARARIDLVDLDLAGLVAISARVLRRRAMQEWSLAEDFVNLPPLARVSLAIGIQLSKDDGAMPTEPRAPRLPPLDPWPAPTEWTGTSERLRRARDK
ncbi:hypothetical protein [Nonomuraea rosea]|uniref:hypothetical protein n=1 Tax=Nonomuraea rosea TaxID=638574 RepID=UPI0031F18118